MKFCKSSAISAIRGVHKLIALEQQIIDIVVLLCILNIQLDWQASFAIGLPPQFICVKCIKRMTTKTNALENCESKPRI